MSWHPYLLFQLNLDKPRAPDENFFPFFRNADILVISSGS